VPPRSRVTKSKPAAKAKPKPKPKPKPSAKAKSRPKAKPRVPVDGSGAKAPVRRPVTPRPTKPSAKASPPPAPPTTTRPSPLPPAGLVGALPWPSVQFIQSHNTYMTGHRAQTATGFRDTVDRVFGLGARGVELDAWQSPDGTPQWSVSHDGPFSAAPDAQLRTYLREVAAWSKDQRSRGGHELLLIVLDMKSDASAGMFADDIDAYVSDALGDCDLFTAGRLVSQHRGPLQGLLASPAIWPSLDAMRNQLAICMSGSPLSTESLAPLTMVYAKTSPRDRIAFADYGAGPPGEGMARPLDRNQIIVTVQGGKPPIAGNWPAVLQALDEPPRLLSRVWWSHLEQLGIGEPIGDSRTALESGAWCVVSDKLADLTNLIGWKGYHARPTRSSK